MVDVVFIFSQSHLDFRIAEFKSICEIFSISVNLENLNITSHVFQCKFNSIKEVEQILSRAILIKYAFEFVSEASSYNLLYENLRNKKEKLEIYDTAEQTYALRFISVGRKKKLDNIEKIKIFLENINFANAQVDLNFPKNNFFLVEEYNNPTDDEPKNIIFGKLIGEGQSNLKTKFNLRDRCYIGNTTMDPELSFIQANIAQIVRNNIVLDPFVGTGGLLLPAAEFGAFVIGTEINYQTARAKGKSSRQGVIERDENESIEANFEQYSILDKLISIIIADSSKHEIWSQNIFFDNIVADPPYGVREKARKLGKKEKNEEKNSNETIKEFQRFPEKKEYKLGNTFCDLLNLAAQKCCIGGTVSFWFPVILESYSEKSLPKHPAMTIISNCEQPLTRKTSRRLLTYRKLRDPRINETSEILNQNVENYRQFLFNSN